MSNDLYFVFIYTKRWCRWNLPENENRIIEGADPKSQQSEHLTLLEALLFRLKHES